MSGLSVIRVEAAQESAQRHVKGWYERITARWCYLFLIPSMILAGLFTFYPTVMSWVYSLMDWSGFTTHMRFVGLSNYVEIVHDPLFWHAFLRSAIFMVVGTPVRAALALVVAIVLNKEAMRLSAVFRTMFFLPVIGTAAVMGVVMNLMLSPNNGPVNALLMQTHLISTPIDFLGPSGALWSSLAVHVWKNFGTTMIYWLAALQTVPKDYLEAAQIDGAGTWALLRYIRLPILIPFALIIVVLTAQENLHAFAIIQAMTGGGPYFASQVIEIYIYQTAFAPEGQVNAVPRLGYASAAGCFFGTATLLVALTQLWVARKVAETRAMTKQARGAA